MKLERGALCFAFLLFSFQWGYSQESLIRRARKMTVPGIQKDLLADSSRLSIGVKRNLDSLPKVGHASSSQRMIDSLTLIKSTQLPQLRIPFKYSGTGDSSINRFRQRSFSAGSITAPLNYRVQRLAAGKKAPRFQIPNYGDSVRKISAGKINIPSDLSGAWAARLSAYEQKLKIPDTGSLFQADRLSITEINAPDLPVKDFSIPGLKELPADGLPSAPALNLGNAPNAANLNPGSLPAINNVSKNLNLPNLNVKENLPSNPQSLLKNAPGELGKIQGQSAEVQKELKQLKALDTTSRQGLEKKAEKDIENYARNSAQGKELDGQMGKVKAQKNAFELYQDMVTSMNKDKAITEGKKLATKEITNEFASQSARLQDGIAQLDKLKKKFHTIPDSRYLPKRPPNEMKGRPFKERFIPGINIQVYQQNKTAFDASTYFLYRLTGRLRMGVGASARFIVNTSDINIRNGRVQAYRMIADFKGFGSWYLHAEQEWTHFSPGAFVMYRKVTDPPPGPWATRMNAGILKTYKISRRIDGQVQLLYNALDWTHFPQNKNTAARFGFEYRLGVKKPENALK